MVIDGNLIPNQENTRKVWIEDFAGNNRQPGFWAWYDPKSKLVFFGGWWAYCPAYFPEEPTENEIRAYVKRQMKNYHSVVFKGEKIISVKFSEPCDTSPV